MPNMVKDECKDRALYRHSCEAKGKRLAPTSHEYRQISKPDANSVFIWIVLREESEEANMLQSVQVQQNMLALGWPLLRSTALLESRLILLRPKMAKPIMHANI